MAAQLTRSAGIRGASGSTVSAASTLVPQLPLDTRPDPKRVVQYERDKNPPADMSFKMVMIGRVEVGKTSLVYTHVNNNQPLPSNGPTIGVDFYNLFYAYDNRTVNMSVWDTSGQERFQSYAPQYFRNANAAVLVFSLADERPDLVMKHLSEDISEFQHHAGGLAEILLVGNKADLVDARRFDHRTMAAFAQEWNFRYVETSAHTGEGVAEAFSSIVQALYVKHGQRIMGRSTVDNKQPLSCPTPRHTLVQIVDPSRDPPAAAAAAKKKARGTCC